MREDLGQGSSVHIAMAMAVPMTLKGDKEGQRASNQAHGPAVAWATSITALVKSYVHRKERAEEVGHIRGTVCLHSEKNEPTKTLW